MYVRCQRCHGATWLGVGSPEMRCERCGQRYRFNGVLTERKADELSQRGRRHARENRIDLPAAISVLLGLMTLDQARELGRDAAPRSAEELARAEPEPAASGVDFDPAFAQAVAEGRLTPLQAFERGSREAYVARLIERHQIDQDQAHAVADNRVSLLAVLRDQRKRESEAVEVAAATPGPASVPSKIVAAVLAALAVVLIGWRLQGIRGPAKPSEPPTPAVHDQASVIRSFTEVLHDEQGRVVKVSGPDACGVMITFCESWAPSRRLMPVQIADSAPPSTHSRLGIVADLDAQEQLFAIPIRKDRDTQLWVLGNGSRPATPFAVPPGILEPQPHEEADGPNDLVEFTSDR